LCKSRNIPFWSTLCGVWFFASIRKRRLCKQASFYAVEKLSIAFYFIPFMNVLMFKPNEFSQSEYEYVSIEELIPEDLVGIEIVCCNTLD